MPKVIFSIIATDLKYTNIISHYLDILLQRNLIQTIHIWNYMKTQTELIQLSKLCNKNTKYVLFEPPLPDEKKGHYYQYYHQFINDSDILIKCDDRIVYIDLNTFGKFVEIITEDGLYFPNIVNNDVCAYFQQEEGSHNLFNYKVDKTELKKLILKSGDFKALSDWHNEYDKADKIHRMFLKNKTRFITENENKIIEYGNHIHLNIFGISGKYAKQMFRELIPTITFTDNSYFGLAPSHNNIKHKIFLGFICVYFSFDEQNKKKLEEYYLNKYEILSNQICNL